MNPDVSFTEQAAKQWFNTHAFRSQFRSLPRLAYFNSGSYGLLANGVREAFLAYLARREERGADWDGWLKTCETLRERLARLLDVRSDEIAITSTASEGLAALASAIEPRPGKTRILISDYDFPSSAHIWHAQRRSGFETVRIVERIDARIFVEDMVARIDDRVAIVMLSHVCYRHGGRLADEDIRKIAKTARACGALVILDSYQIVGTEPVHPRSLGVDVCVGGTLKYLLGSSGCGFLYVDAELARRLEPRTSGWFAQAHPELMNGNANIFSPTARRFQGGTPNIAGCHAAIAGLDIILEAGVEAIGSQIACITHHALDRFDEAGIPVSTPRRPDLRGPMLAVPARDERALVALLAERDIILSSRDNRVRMGFHAYNDEEDVERLVAALATHRNLLGEAPGHGAVTPRRVRSAPGSDPA